MVLLLGVGCRDILIDRANTSTTVRLASLEEVLAAKAYICFVSRGRVGRSREYD